MWDAVHMLDVPYSDREDAHVGCGGHITCKDM